MTRTLHKPRIEGDSTTAGDIPGTVDVLGGYLDGNYQTVPALRKRFPKKPVITYTVNGSTSGATFIDCEAGDATPPSAAKYVQAERTKNHWPGIYTPLAQIAAVCHALHTRGLGPDVPIQTAHYTGKPHICGEACLKPYGPLPFRPLIVATQYATQGIGAPGHYDLSILADHLPGFDPPRTRGFNKPTSVALRVVHRALTKRVAHGDYRLSGHATARLGELFALAQQTEQIR